MPTDVASVDVTRPEPADGDPHGDARCLLWGRSMAVSFGDREILRDVDITLRAGEPLLVRGVSGCGKTTLLRALAALHPLDRGTLEFVDGHTLLRGPEYRRKVTYVGQQPALHTGTVEHNLRRPFLFRTATTPFDDEHALRLLDEVALGDVLARDVRELSVGQRQRVCLVRSVLIAPHVLLLDEPTSALDQDSASRLAGVIERWVQAPDRSFVLVTHAADRLADMCTATLELPTPAAGSANA